MGVNVFEGVIVGPGVIVLVRVGVRVGVFTFVFVDLGVKVAFFAQEGEREEEFARTENAPMIKIANNRKIMRGYFIASS